MNKGVEILLNRMDSNPEEFIGTGSRSKWRDYFTTYREYLNEEDVEAFETKLNTLIQDKFTEVIMKELLEDKPSDEGKSMGRHPIQGTGLGGQTLRLSSVDPNGFQSVWSNPIPTIGNGGTGASTVIQLGNEMLDENVLRKIKRKLGI
jgi:hypothetical protein